MHEKTDQGWPWPPTCVLMRCLGPGAAPPERVRRYKNQQLWYCCSSSNGSSVKGGVPALVFTISLRVGDGVGACVHVYGGVGGV